MVMRVEPDYLTRAVVKTPAIRLAIGSFKDLTSEGLIRHDTDPVAGRLLAGALSSAALMIRSASTIPARCAGCWSMPMRTDVSAG